MGRRKGKSRKTGIPASRLPTPQNKQEKPVKYSQTSLEALVDSLSDFSFRHRSLPKCLATIAEDEGDKKNTFDGFNFMKTRMCDLDEQTKTLHLSRAELKEDEEIEKRLDRTMNLSKTAIERSKKLVEELEVRKHKPTPPDKVKLFEMYMERVIGVPGFLFGFQGGVYNLKPTFLVESEDLVRMRIDCAEISNLVRSSRTLGIEFEDGVYENDIKVTEKELTVDNQEEVRFSSSSGYLHVASPRRVEIHGKHRKNSESAETDFIVTLLNEGNLFGLRELCGTYRRKMLSADKFLTWKILF